MAIKIKTHATKNKAVHSSHSHKGFMPCAPPRLRRRTIPVYVDRRQAFCGSAGRHDGADRMRGVFRNLRRRNLQSLFQAVMRVRGLRRVHVHCAKYASVFRVVRDNAQGRPRFGAHGAKVRGCS